MLTRSSAAEDIGVPKVTPMLVMLTETGRHVIRCPFDTAFLHTGQRHTRSVSYGEGDEDEDTEEDWDGDEDAEGYEDEEGNEDEESNEGDDGDEEEEEGEDEEEEGMRMRMRKEMMKGTMRTRMRILVGHGLGGDECHLNPFFIMTVRVI